MFGGHGGHWCLRAYEFNSPSSLLSSRKLGAAAITVCLRHGSGGIMRNTARARAHEQKTRQKIRKGIGISPVLDFPPIPLRSRHWFPRRFFATNNLNRRDRKAWGQPNPKSVSHAGLISPTRLGFKRRQPIFSTLKAHNRWPSLSRRGYTDPLTATTKFQFLFSNGASECKCSPGNHEPWRKSTGGFCETAGQARLPSWSARASRSAAAATPRKPARKI